MNRQKTDIINVNEAGTLYGLFQQRLKRSPLHPAYRSYCNDSATWHDVSWQEVADQVARWQSALAQEKLHAGDCVALNLRNCKEWVYFDLAAMGLGLIAVPLYPDDRPDNIAYILQDADVKLLLLQNVKQWKRIQPALTEQHTLSRIIIKQTDTQQLEDSALYVEQWLPDQWNDLAQREDDPYKLASIIYTSGTTGRPKGVMLSHHNMLSVAHGSLQYFDIFTDDLFLSFLPLSHTLERTAGYYLPMMAGATVAYARSIALLQEDILMLSPAVLIAVPRIFERIYNRLHTQLAEKPWFSQILFKMTAAIGWSRFRHSQGSGNWHLGFLLWPLLDKVVAGRMQARMGGQLRLAISGGAALPHRAAKLFSGLGLTLLQGYGLTETSPVISVNEPERNKPDSVGRPIPGVSVKIGDSAELLVKGPGNMLGYWNNPQATAQIIDTDGWLHTGDQARIGGSGHIYITGRIKDILVLSSGEKVPPTDIEVAIVQDEHFDQAVIVGEGRAYLSALIVLNPDKWPALAQSLDLNPTADDSLNDKKLNNFVIHRTRALLHDFPAYAKIRRITLTLHAWTMENDLLTPTMKIKRAKVIKYHQTDIAMMYK